DSATCSSSEFNTGGAITVNGYSITIPENLIFQLPAAWIPFKEICSGGFTGNEVDVFGNIVSGKAIAGIVSMSQLLLQGGTGYIDSIDGANGKIHIKGGPTLRINDPNGVYGKAYTEKPAFTADDENPSITAFSGFPMCIPRSASDELCPLSNRPSGQRTFNAPDPLVMAPFIVGDYLEFSGIMIGGEVVCYAIVAANVQIRSSSPVYIRIEDALIGVYDGDPNSEFGDTRFIGYLSDSSASVTASAIDVDHCTGEETDRIVGSATIKAGDARNKFTWRADSTTLSKYTREYRIKASTGTKATKNGILAGQYVQPVTEWIFPELTTPGLNPPALDFTGMTNVVNGIVQDEHQFGQLKPWP
ncbi:hypothetical protein NA57DRAFT_24250, partial [Rhizodiscina lignyota]